jgi:hypothetical protein
MRRRKKYPMAMFMELEAITIKLSVKRYSLSG